jgi:hypothetical protein
MLQILKVTLDARGALVRAVSLPLIFESRDYAIDVMDQFIRSTHENGRSGYNARDEYWWGCDDTPDIQIHRYMIGHCRGHDFPVEAGALSLFASKVEVLGAEPALLEAVIH